MEIMGLLVELVKPSVSERSTFSSGPSFAMNLSLLDSKNQQHSTSRRQKKSVFLFGTD